MKTAVRNKLSTNYTLLLSVIISGLVMLLTVVSVYYFWLPNNQLLNYVILSFFSLINYYNIGVHGDKRWVRGLLVVLLLCTVHLLAFDFFFAVTNFMFACIACKKIGLLEGKAKTILWILIIVIAIVILLCTLLALLSIGFSGSVYVFSRDFTVLEYISPDGTVFWKVSTFSEEKYEPHFSYLRETDIIRGGMFGDFYRTSKVLDRIQIG